jgi:hypothetical protein
MMDACAIRVLLQADRGGGKGIKPESKRKGKSRHNCRKGSTPA